MRQDIRDMTEGAQAIHMTQERRRNSSYTAIDAWYDLALGQDYIDWDGQSAYVDLLQDQHGRYHFINVSRYRQYVPKR